MHLETETEAPRPSMTKAFLTSNNQNWATPWPVIRALSPEFCFTLDVAAGIKTAKAPKFYTEDDDAFSRDWGRDADGGDAWCNPPYGPCNGKTIGDWVQKTWSFRKSLTSVLLLPINKQDQDWFHDLVLKDGEYRPVRGRIAFLDPETGKPPVKIDPETGKKVSAGNSQGSMLIVFGPGYSPRAPKTFDYRSIHKASRKNNAR